VALELVDVVVMAVARVAVGTVVVDVDVADTGKTAAAVAVGTAVLLAVIPETWKAC